MIQTQYVRETEQPHAHVYTQFCGKSSSQSQDVRLNYSYIVIIQLFSMIHCIGSRCRRVAILNRIRDLKQTRRQSDDDGYSHNDIPDLVQKKLIEVKIPRFRFTGTGDIHVPVPVNRGTTCNLRNPRYSAVRKPMREW